MKGKPKPRYVLIFREGQACYIFITNANFHPLEVKFVKYCDLHRLKMHSYQLLRAFIVDGFTTKTNFTPLIGK